MQDFLHPARCNELGSRSKWIFHRACKTKDPLDARSSDIKRATLIYILYHTFRHRVACRPLLTIDQKPNTSKSQEMIECLARQVGNPSEYWNYRDESFVSFWASAVHRRGVANRVATIAVNFLNRYRASFEREKCERMSTPRVCPWETRDCASLPS